MSSKILGNSRKHFLKHLAVTSQIYLIYFFSFSWLRIWRLNERQNLLVTLFILGQWPCHFSKTVTEKDKSYKNTPWKQGTWRSTEIRHKLVACVGQVSPMLMPHSEQNHGNLEVLMFGFFMLYPLIVLGLSFNTPSLIF